MQPQPSSNQANSYSLIAGTEDWVSDPVHDGMGSVAYLGFHKGAKFSLATNAYIMGGQTMFSNFFPMELKTKSLTQFMMVWAQWRI